MCEPQILNTPQCTIHPLATVDKVSELSNYLPLPVPTVNSLIPFWITYPLLYLTASPVDYSSPITSILTYFPHPTGIFFLSSLSSADSFSSTLSKLLLSTGLLTQLDENHANKAPLRPETTHNKLTAKSFYSHASTKTDEHKSWR